MKIAIVSVILICLLVAQKVAAEDVDQIALEIYITGLNLLVADPARDSGDINSVWVLSLKSDHQVGGQHAHPHRTQLRLGCIKDKPHGCYYSFDLDGVDLKLVGSSAGAVELGATYKTVLSMKDLDYGSPKPGLLKALSSATDLHEVSARWQLIGGALDVWKNGGCVVYDIGPIAKPVKETKKVYAVVKYSTLLFDRAKLLVTDHDTKLQIDSIALDLDNPTLCPAAPCSSPIQIWLVNEPPPYNPPIPPVFNHMVELDRLTDDGLEGDPNVPHLAKDQNSCPIRPAMGTTFCPDTRYP